MMMYSSSHCMQEDHSAYLTNAVSGDVAATADLIYGKVHLHCLKKKKKTNCDSVTTAQLSLSCRKGPYTEEEAVNCKSSCQLYLCSPLI